MSNLFDVPGSGDRDASEFFNLKDNVGALVLFSPTEYIESITTVNGEKDAVKTDVVVFTKDGATEYTESLIFAGAVIGKLKSYAKRGSGRVLARIGRGEAKKGQQAPYVLNVPNDADRQVATDYLNKNADPFAL